MGLEHEELSGSVIGAAIEVHTALGPGFLEPDYENVLALDLLARGVRFEQQLAVPILYRGSEVGLHGLDLLVAVKRVIASQRPYRDFLASLESPLFVRHPCPPTG